MTIHIDDKTVKFPDADEQLAREIKGAWQLTQNGRNDWREGSLELAIKLAKARAVRNDRELGAWLGENGLGGNVLSKEDRSALIEMGAEPERFRLILEKTDRWSWQHIYRKEWEVRQVTNQVVQPEVANAAIPNAPNFGAAMAAALAHEAETGSFPTSTELVSLGVAERRTADTVLLALKWMRAERDAPVKYTKAQQTHIEAAIKLRARKLENEFEERVNIEVKLRCERAFPMLQERENRVFAAKQMFLAKAVLTKAEYDDILFCTHNKNPSEERRHRADVVVIDKKVRLTGEIDA